MPARLHRILFCAVLAALPPSFAAAQKTIQVPSGQASIQAGIDAASDGDTVLVSPGTYYENIDFKGKGITVKSTDGAAKTIIDAGASGNVVQFISGETRSAVLDGFTVQNSGRPPDSLHDPNGTSGGGILVYQSAPVLNALVVRNNLCTGIYVVYGAPLIQNSTVSDTVAFTLNATQSDNYTCTYGNGTGINFRFAYVNPAGKNWQPTVLNSTIARNIGTPLHSSIVRGGGIASLDAQPFIQGNVIFGNSAPGYNAIGLGGGIDIWDGGATIVQNVIYGNSAEAGGGGISISQPIGANEDPVVVVNNTIADNVISTPTPGSGLSGDGSQIFLSVLRNVTFVNNTISGSTTNALFECGPNNPPYKHYLVVDSSNVFNSSGAAFSPTCLAIAGGLGYNNISADPLFAAASSGNYQPTSHSPLLDAGNNSAPYLPATDFLGNSRIQDATGKGYRIVDIGAYEFTGASTTPPTTLSLDTFPAFVPVNQPYTIIARLTSALGVPTGTVTFYDGGAAIGTAQVNSGVATFTTAPLPQGDHLIYATYAATPPFAASNAVEAWLYVYGSGAATTTSLTSSLNPSFINQSVTFTATVTSSSGIPTGTIQFSDGGTLLGTPQTLSSSGMATYSTSTLTAGNHTITATYAPAGAFVAGSTSLVQKVQAIATSIAVSGAPNPTVEGASVTLSATVTSANGTPTGSVQFTANGNPLATVPVDSSGQASYSTSSLPSGTLTIYANYQPTGAFAASSGSFTENVLPITNAINLASSQNPSDFGQPVTFVASISSNGGHVPTGNVTFYNGSSYLGQQAVDATGTASLTVPGSFFVVGSNNIVANFTATGSSTAVSTHINQTVNGLSTATLVGASPTTGIANTTSITLTATVSATTPGKPVPTGSVLFYSNSGQLRNVPLVNGVATLSITLPGGVDHIYGVYYPESSNGYNGSTSNTVDVTLSAAPTNLSLSVRPNPAQFFSPITFSAQLTVNGQPAPAGLTIYFTTTLPGGSGAETHAAVTDATGTATFTSSTYAANTLNVVATFLSTSDLLGSQSSPTTLVVLPATPTVTLTATPNPGYENQNVTITTTLNSTASVNPYGTVVVSDNGTVLRTITIPYPSATNTSSFTLNNLAVGTHSLTAAFTPADNNFLTSTSAPLSLIILPQSFTVTLSTDHLSIVSGHHKSLTVSIASIGGLTAPFTMACGANLPQWTSCEWGQTSLTLPANGTVSTSLTIDTNQLPGFLNSSLSPERTNPFWNIRFAVLPVALFAFFRRRNLRANLPRLSALLLLTLAAGMTTACGANKYPYSTAPGTYTIPLMVTEHPATAGSNPITKVVPLTLEVTN